MGLAPDAFWALSISEWIALVDAVGIGAASFGEADLHKLIKQYPDEKL